MLIFKSIVMKKIFKITCLILLISSFGCKKLLDQPPLSQLASDQFWKTPDDAKAGIAGLYDGLQDMFNSQYIYWGDGRSDNLTYHPTYNDALPLAINVLTPTTNGADWTLIYATISRANFAIKYIPTISGIDPIQVLELQKIISDLKRSGIGILVTDHNVRETLAVTDRAYIINNGRIFRAGTPDALGRDPEVKRVYLGESFRWEQPGTAPIQ